MAAQMNLDMVIRTMFGPGAEARFNKIQAINQKAAGSKQKVINLNKMDLAQLRQIEQKLISTNREYRGSVRWSNRLHQVRGQINKMLKAESVNARSASAIDKQRTRELAKQLTLRKANARASAAQFAIPASTGGFFNRMDQVQAGQMPAFFDRTTAAAKKTTGQVGVLKEELNGVARTGKFVFEVLQAFLLYRGFVFLTTQIQEFIRELVALEHEVAIVQTQLGHLGGDFRANITRNVIAVAQETGMAFESVAKAEFEVVSANIELAESYGIVELAAKAAVAGGIEDVELAFNAALTQVNTFKDSLLTFEEAFDKQFNLIKRGIFTYEQFATVSGSIAESFQRVGQDVDQANAALAAISQVFTGKQIERGATGLRNALVKIGENRAIFAELGVSVEDASGNFRDLNVILRDLDGVLAGMSEAKRFDVLEEIFESERAARGIGALMTELDSFEQFLIEQKLASGDLSEAFDTVNASLKTQAGILRNDIVPAADPFVDLLGSMATDINRMDDALPGFTSNLFTLAVALGAVGATSLGVRGAVTSGFFPGAGAIRAPLSMGAVGASSPINAGARQRFAGRLGGMSRFGAAGVGLTAVGGGVIAANQEGFNTGNLISAGIGGATVGALTGAGVPGAVVGGGVAIGGVLIGELVDHMKDRGDEPAKSFADSFSNALERTSGDVASAFSTAVAAEIAATGDRSTLQMLAGGLTAGGSVVGQDTRGFWEALTEDLGSLFTGNKVRGGAPVDVVGVDIEQTLTDLDGQFEQLATRARILGASEMDEKQARQVLVDKILDEQLSLDGLEGGTRETIAAQRDLIRAVSVNNVVEEDRILLLQTLRDLEAERISEMDATLIITKIFGETLGRATVEVDRFAKSEERANDLLGIDFETAASVFSLMGENGNEAASAFENAADAAAKLQIALGLVSAVEMVGLSADGGLKNAVVSMVAGFFGIETGNLQSASALHDLQTEISGLSGDEVIAAIDSFLNMGDAAAGAADGMDLLQIQLEGLNRQMQRNSLQQRKIEMGAELQNRDLTAEELDHITRLENSNLELDIQKFRLEEFGNSLEVATQAVQGFTDAADGTGGTGTGLGSGGTSAGGTLEGGQATVSNGVLYTNTGEAVVVKQASFGPADTYANARTAQMYGASFLTRESADLATIRAFDQMTGGQQNVNKIGFDRAFSQFVIQLSNQFKESTQRGATNLYVQGDTMLTDIDQALRMLRQQGPQTARTLSGGR